MRRNIGFPVNALKLDCAKETKKIVAAIQKCVVKRFRKGGVVVAVSGGIDSSLVAALCVQALGRDRTLGLLMPEKESSPETPKLSQLLVNHLGIPAERTDITNILTAVGCYERRDRAIKMILPDYTPKHKCKLVLPSLFDNDRYRLFSVIIQSPEGERKRARLSLQAYLEILAAMNFKQRVRKILEYYRADRFNYAVAGTANRLEYDQGFFVKAGDGAADLKPIAHLYKTQVYQLAEFLGIPEDISKHPPTTDTYSMPQSQEEFYFSVPYELMDYCLYGKNHGLSAEDIAQATALQTKQVEKIYREIDSKRVATQYQHAPPVLVEEINMI